jgi:hypothetical protein
MANGACRGAKPLQSLFGKEGLRRFAHIEVQQDAAGVWGVPRFLFLVPQEWGIKGVEEKTSQCPQGAHPVPAVAKSKNKALDCAGLCIDATLGMLTGRTN